MHLNVNATRHPIGAGMRQATPLTIRRQIGHDWAALFDLVMDIERYPLFVPGCTAEQVLSRRDVAPGRIEVVSRMTVGKPPLGFSYTNRTVADRPTRRIGVTSTDGPLKLLQVLWRFLPAAPAGTEIALTAVYEFRSALVGSLASGPLETMFSRIVEAFEHRANTLATPA